MTFLVRERVHEHLMSRIQKSQATGSLREQALFVLTLWTMPFDICFAFPGVSLALPLASLAVSRDDEFCYRGRRGVR